MESKEKVDIINDEKMDIIDKITNNEIKNFHQAQVPKTDRTVFWEVEVHGLLFEWLSIYRISHGMYLRHPNDHIHAFRVDSNAIQIFTRNPLHQLHRKQH